MRELRASFERARAAGYCAEHDRRAAANRYAVATMRLGAALLDAVPSLVPEADDGEDLARALGRVIARGLQP